MDKLERGDIIVFKAEQDDWLSKSIAWFSGSDTSHAAMLYREDAIIEMGAGGVSVNDVAFYAGQEVYVMRLGHAPATAPLLAAADAYRQAGAKYDFPALFLLAGLFLFRKIKPNHKLIVLGSKILMQAITQIDHFINYHILKLKKPVMVCSQFVYQVYFDCGSDYRIDVDFGYQAPAENTLGGQPPAPGDNVYDGQLPALGGGLCLADYLNGYRSNAIGVPGFLDEDSVSEFFDEGSVLEAFYHELTRTALKDENAVFQAVAEGRQPYQETLRLGAAFLEQAGKLLEALGTDVPLNALFVTPGDFVRHSRNLETVMLTGMERKKK